LQMDTDNPFLAGLTDDLPPAVATDPAVPTSVASGLGGIAGSSAAAPNPVVNAYAAPMSAPAEAATVTTAAPIPVPVAASAPTAPTAPATAPVVPVQVPAAAPAPVPVQTMPIQQVAPAQQPVANPAALATPQTIVAAPVQAAVAPTTAGVASAAPVTMPMPQPTPTSDSSMGFSLPTQSLAGSVAPSPLAQPQAMSTPAAAAAAAGAAASGPDAILPKRNIMYLTPKEAIEKALKLPKGYALVSTDDLKAGRYTNIAQKRSRVNDEERRSIIEPGSGMGARALTSAELRSLPLPAPGISVALIGPTSVTLAPDAAEAAASTASSSLAALSNIPVRQVRATRVATTPKSQEVPLSDLMKKCLTLLEHIMGQKNCGIFHQPVDPERDGARNYFDIIKRPMDLGTVREKIVTGKYNESLEAFISDVRLTFTNATTYNPPESWIHGLANNLLQMFNRKVEDIISWRERTLSKSKSSNKRVKTTSDDHGDGASRSGSSSRSKTKAKDAEEDDDETDDGGEEEEAPQADGAMSNPLMQMMQQMMMAGKTPDMMQMMMLMAAMQQQTGGAGKKSAQQMNPANFMNMMQMMQMQQQQQQQKKPKSSSSSSKSSGGSKSSTKSKSSSSSFSASSPTAQSMPPMSSAAAAASYHELPATTYAAPSAPVKVTEVSLEEKEALMRDLGSLSDGGQSRVMNVVQAKQPELYDATTYEVDFSNITVSAYRAIRKAIDEELGIKSAPRRQSTTGIPRAAALSSPHNQAAMGNRMPTPTNRYPVAPSPSVGAPISGRGSSDEETETSDSD